VLHQQSKVESPRSALKVPLVVPAGAGRGRFNTARVVVAWRPVAETGTPELEPREVELEAELETSASTRWTCRKPSGSGWAEALSSARCSEIVLTALSDDPPAKHLIFELAGFLTVKLAATQPLIRVRFLAPSPRAQRRVARFGTV